MAFNRLHKQIHTQASNYFAIQWFESDTASSDGIARTLPFTPSDATAESESEYQTAVSGSRRHVDLAREIESSGFFRNLKKRAMLGDTPPSQITALEHFLEGNPNRVWEK